ncbi:MAG: hypothetical protein FJ291_17130 [Planctomycetes bacterium]|nr:hypothetical protein [Planctomycetota bacterium]
MGKMASPTTNGNLPQGEFIPAGHAPEQRLEAIQAIEATIGSLPEVCSVLWNPQGRYIRVVTAVSDYTDESLERVAEKELELMDALPELLLEFRVIPAERVERFLSAGFLPALDQRTEQTGQARPE